MRQDQLNEQLVVDAEKVSFASDQVSVAVLVVVSEGVTVMLNGEGDHGGNRTAGSKGQDRRDR